jgi:hypothetical protein
MPCLNPTFCSVQAERAAPSIRRRPPFTGLEVTYLFRINFCSAWICLLIDAINATIDFRTSAFETEVVLDLIEYGVV